jgi:hypothetical protein
MEDRGPVPGGPSGRFIGHEAGRGRDDQAQDGLERDPLIGAAGARRSRGHRRGGAAGAAGPRASPGDRPAGPTWGRALGEARRRVAGDQFVELVAVEKSLGLRRDPVVVAAGPGGSGRSAALDQEQQQRPRAPSRQSPEPIRPHHTPAIEPDPSRTWRPVSRMDIGEMGPHAQASLRNAPILYPTAARHCKRRSKNRGRGPATSEPAGGDGGSGGAVRHQCSRRGEIDGVGAADEPCPREQDGPEQGRSPREPDGIGSDRVPVEYPNIDRSESDRPTLEVTPGPQLASADEGASARAASTKSARAMRSFARPRERTLDS